MSTGHSEESLATSSGFAISTANGYPPELAVSATSDDQ
jgi:hypothetical protein